MQAHNIAAIGFQLLEGFMQYVWIGSQADPTGLPIWIAKLIHDFTTPTPPSNRKMLFQMVTAANVTCKCGQQLAKLDRRLGDGMGTGLGRAEVHLGTHIIYFCFQLLQIIMLPRTINKGRAALQNTWEVLF